MTGQLLTCVSWLLCVLFAVVVQADDAATTPRSVLATAMAGPLGQVEQIVFAVRLGYDDPHWYANIGYFCDDEHKKAYPGNGRPDVGKLCLLDVRTKAVTVLFDAQGGSVRDPEVHYDARKVLFSYRPSGTDYYHLYEINLDGSGLRQFDLGAVMTTTNRPTCPTAVSYSCQRVVSVGQLLDDASGGAVSL